MEDHELEALLRDLESDRTERKQSLADSEKIRQAICAFANDLPNHCKPSVIFVGATDDGLCAHLPITDDLLLNLANMRSDGNITPFPSVTVQKRVLNGCEMAVVIVEPSDFPPVRVRGRTWIRVGPRRDTASEDEERRLTEKRRSGDLPFDLRPVPSATIDDLDLELFVRVYLPSALPPDVLEENRRSTDAQLASMRFTTAPPTTIPTNLGVLVLGKDPRQYVPGAYIQFLRMPETELTDVPRDQKEIDGPLPDQLRFLDEVLEANIAVATQIAGSPTEIRQPDYPLVALQQIARNAVLHRSYDATHAPTRITWFSDRIEIQSPGGPFGQVNLENFGHPGVTDYRNPHLAEAMKTLGYVQRFGFGIPMAQRAMRDNGNPPVKFEVKGSHVLAILRMTQ